MRMKWSKREGKMVPAARGRRQPPRIEPMMVTRQDRRNMKHLQSLKAEGETYPASHVHSYTKGENQVCALARNLVKQATGAGVVNFPPPDHLVENFPQGAKQGEVK